MTITVLFVENDPDFMDTRAEFLENAGYQVLKAYSLEQARQLMTDRHVHLAILDIRMIDDDDEKDTSGLTLAKDPVFQPIPKIILTGFPTYQTVREVLGPVLDGLPPAVEYLSKHDGPEVMIQTVATVFERYVRINQHLLMRWRGSLSFLHLTHLIVPETVGTLWPERVNELEDLWRKLFSAYRQITIGRLFVRRKDKVILEVYAYGKEQNEAQFLVACGDRHTIVAENERYTTLVPKGNGFTNTILLETVEAIHFAASLYQLAGADLETITSFATFYPYRPTETVLVVVEQLFTNTLAAWNTKGRAYTENKSLDKLYQDWWKLDEETPTQAKLEQRVQRICQETLTAGAARLDYGAHKLIFYLQDGSPIFYPNPVTCFFEQQIRIDSPMLYGVTHGGMDTDVVLVGGSGHTWLVDFAGAGRGPILCDFVALEMAVKLNLLDTTDLQMRHALDARLVALTELNAAISLTGFPAEFDKLLRTVEKIRRLAATVVGSDPAPYLIGVFFSALTHIATFEPDVQYTKQELVPFVHSLLMAAMSCARLVNVSPSNPKLPPQALANLWIDESNREVWVEGRQVDLTPQEFDMLAYMYKNRGLLCSRQAIVEKALGERYEEEATETSRLNSAMSRLRQKLERDPEHPQYIITVRGHGYKLVA